MRIRKYARIAALAFALLGLLACGSCKRTPGSPAESPKEPTVRLYLVSTMAGALEPCGCQKDMLGGVDHMAEFIRKEHTAAPNRLLLAAGPLLFMNPEIEEKKKTQDNFKAEAIAQSFRDLGLAAWTPGCNDWASGAPRLSELVRETGGALLGANLKAPSVNAAATEVKKVGEHTVGIAGVTVPKHRGRLPTGVTVTEPKAALANAKNSLEQAGAQILVALIALDRGEALRLAETVPGFHVIVVGKPSDEGEGNDGPTPPVLVGNTLVVQAPNHLQAVAVVDLFVRGKSFEFKDGSGLEVAEKKTSLQSRIADLEKRIAGWEKQGSVAAKDLDARRRDLAQMKSELKKLQPPSAPSKGSFFRYELARINEALGKDDAVAGRMAGYYKRVNEHNRKAFAGRLPPKVAEGQSHYVGAEECSNCHDEAYEFWKKTRHAKAYATLADDHKQFNLDCVGCHVTGYEQPGGSTVTHVDLFKDVQCETCHGPGSKHIDSSEPADILRVPKKKQCASQCHHPPHVGPDWSVDEAWKGIIGPGHGEPAK